jgi:tungstate transport system ATP-binding protein
MTQLQLENISYSMDGVPLLHGINLTQNGKGIKAVLGPNGAGKTLFLSLIHGLIRPDTGQVTWDGKAAHKTKVARSFVFQNPIVLRRSVRANLAYPLAASGRTASVDTITNMLELAHLGPLGDQPAASLSGGEVQRMAVARALITNPDTLLLDEPCSNLDPASTKLIESMILDFVTRGGNVFISTHDLKQAKRLADVVLFLENGQLLEHHAAKDFFADPKTTKAQDYLDGVL